MMKLVLPCISFWKPRWMRCSVRRSMELVASSRISMGGSVSMMRAMHKSCFCPCESPDVSEIGVS